ncbi:MAG: hypothetical protein R3Y60_01955 [bacterium]
MTFIKQCKFIEVTEVEEDDGELILTVEDDILSYLCLYQNVSLVIDKVIPNTSKCLRITVTDGDTDLPIYVNNQYFRPCQLKCHSVLNVKYKADPKIFEFISGGKLR